MPDTPTTPTNKGTKPVIPNAPIRNVTYTHISQLSAIIRELRF